MRRTRSLPPTDDTIQIAIPRSVLTVHETPVTGGPGRRARRGRRPRRRAGPTGARGMTIDLDAIRGAGMGPLAFVIALGMRPSRGARPDRVRVLCPVHQEKVPSCDVGVRQGRIAWICRSCGEGGDVFALVAAVRGLDARRDFRRVVLETAEVVGVQVDDGAPVRRRRRRDPIVDLALAIDRAADDWIAGRVVRTDPMIGGASADELCEALETLAAADDARAQDRRAAA